jgi:hypothetical protein
MNIESHYTLEAREGTQTLEGVPFGRYEVFIFTYAYAADPARTEIKVGPDEPASVAVTMRAHGTIIGQVEYRSRPSNDFEFSRITVRGPLGGDKEETRTILPADESFDERRLYRSGEDFIRRGSFMILNLEAGEYEVTVEAAGQTPQTHTRRAILGIPTMIEIKYPVD